MNILQNAWHMSQEKSLKTLIIFLYFIQYGNSGSW